MILPDRDYQIDLLERSRDAYRHGVRRLCMQLSTGGGKTVIFSFIAREAAAKGKRVLILVHRRELLKQACNKLQSPHGVIAAGFTPSPRMPIQIASKDTMVNRLDRYGEFDLIIADEAHHITSTTWMKIINSQPKARLLGVTATPARMTGAGLGNLFEELICGPQPSWLMDHGHLAPVRIFTPPVIDTSQVPKRGGDFSKSALNQAADRPTVTGDAIEHYCRHANGLPALAFCVSVEHAKHTAMEFCKAGFRFQEIDGDTDTKDRDRAIKELGDGTIHGLTTCDLANEGLDIPVVVAGIFLRPTQSLTLALQQWGRCLRPAPGKRHAILLDHAGNCSAQKHGYPDDDREWDLDHGDIAPKTSAGVESVRICPACYYTHRPTPRCPNCGHVYEIQGREIDHVEGDLIEVERRRRVARIQVGRAQTREELEAIAAERGYKPGWVHAILRARAAKENRDAESRSTVQGEIQTYLPERASAFADF